MCGGMEPSLGWQKEIQLQQRATLTQLAYRRCTEGSLYFVLLLIVFLLGSPVSCQGEWCYYCCLSLNI
jgi:hypothetical protein